MKYIIDANIFYQKIAGLPDPNERGVYALKMAMMLMSGQLPGCCSKIPKPRSKAAIGEYTEQFETFWKNYPSCNNKVNKGGAYIEWKKITNGADLLSSNSENSICYKCINALKWQKDSESWKNENGKYIPKPETYLLKRKWEDEPPKQPIKTKTGYLDMNGIWREQ
jgi:hypothetical protein